MQGHSHNASALEKNIRLWLRPFDHEARHQRIQKTILNDSGTWLRGNHSFQQWMTEVAGSRLLWIRGRPGAGKTFLSSSIIQSLLSSGPNSMTLYFYFDESEAQQNLAISLARSFIVQLMNLLNENDCKSLLEKLLPIYRRSTEEQAQNFEVLWKVVLDTLSPVKRIWCIIDGLDECKDRVESQITERLRQLSRLPHLRDLRLMILSRDNEDIRHSLDESCYNIWIARQNDRDIKCYINREIALLNLTDFSLTSDVEQHIRARLREGSQGTFLWWGSRMILSSVG